MSAGVLIKSGVLFVQIWYLFYCLAIVQNFVIIHLCSMMGKCVVFTFKRSNPSKNFLNLLCYSLKNPLIGLYNVSHNVCTEIWRESCGKLSSSKKTCMFLVWNLENNRKKQKKLASGLTFIRPSFCRFGLTSMHLRSCTWFIHWELRCLPVSYGVSF